MKKDVEELGGESDWKALAGTEWVGKLDLLRDDPRGRKHPKKKKNYKH